MDLICCTCGEPWEMDYATHDNPGEFKRAGAAIVHCPCCKERKTPLSAEEKANLAAARELGILLGGDVDGYACQLEDMGLT